MKYEAGVRDRGRGIADMVMAGFISMDATHARGLRSCRPWGMALVLLVVAACGGGGGGGGSSGGGSGSESITSISIEPDPVEVGRGSTETLSVTAETSNGDTRSVRRTDVNDWESTDPDIADVKNGVVSGKRIGNTTVKAFLGDHTAWADVAVSALQVRPARTHLPVNCTEQMAARMVSADGGATDVSKSVDWSISNESVATVNENENGQVMAKAPGSAVVHASHSGAEAGALVTVAELKDGNDEVGLRLRDALRRDAVLGDEPPYETLSLAQGEGIRLDAMGVFKDAMLANRNVTDCVDWQSSDPAVVAVDDEGRITAVGAHDEEETVTATYASDSPNEQDVQVNVKITGTVTHLFIHDPPSEIDHGSTAQLTAKAKIENQEDPVDVTPAVEWSSGDKDVITVSNDSATAGQIKGVQTGKAKITAELAELEDRKASEEVYVVSVSGAPDQITVSAEPNVVLTDPDDSSSICARLVPNDPDNGVVPERDIYFSILSGGSDASFSDGDQEMIRTTAEGESACLELIPEDNDSSGDDYSVSVTVQAHDPESGLMEEAVVNVVGLFSSVFGSSTSRVDPQYDDTDGVYTAEGGTTFEAVFVNGSNREFDIDVDSVVFCKREPDGEDVPINLSADIAGDSRVSGGGEILVAVTTENEHDGTGFAIGLDLSEEDTGQIFPVVHQFTETEVSCEPN